jgi:hypothetical protein
MQAVQLGVQLGVEAFHVRKAGRRLKIEMRTKLS